MIIALAFSGLFLAVILSCLFYATKTIRERPSEHGSRKDDLKVRIRGVRIYVAFMVGFIILFVGYGVWVELGA